MQDLVFKLLSGGVFGKEILNWCSIFMGYNKCRQILIQSQEWEIKALWVIRGKLVTAMHLKKWRHSLFLSCSKVTVKTIDESIFFFIHCGQISGLDARSGYIFFYFTFIFYGDLIQFLEVDSLSHNMLGSTISMWGFNCMRWGLYVNQTNFLKCTYKYCSALFYILYFNFKGVKWSSSQNFTHNSIFLCN